MAILEASMATSPIRSTPARSSSDPSVLGKHATSLQLLQVEGDTVRAGAVAKRLGVPVPVVEQLRQTGQLLAIPGDHGYHYPT